MTVRVGLGFRGALGAPHKGGGVAGTYKISGGAFLGEGRRFDSTRLPIPLAWLRLDISKSCVIIINQ